MKCPKCNNVLAPGDAYCGNCGHKQIVEVAPPAARKEMPPPLPARTPSAARKPRPIAGIIVAAAVCILLGAGVKFVLNRPSSSSGGNTPTPPVVNGAPKADYTVSAVDFLAEFARDEAAATAKYKGKWVDIRGWLSTDELTEDGQHATTITLTSWCFEDLLLFKLNREEMDKRFLMIDYYALWRMMGRFSGHEGKRLVFEQSVLMTTAADYPPLPVEAKAGVAEVVSTMQDSDRLVRSKLVGRKIQVSGTISEVGKAEESLGIITLAGEDETDRLSCEVPSSKLATFEQGQQVTLTGWLVCTAAMPQMGLDVSFDEPAPTPAPAAMASPQPGGGDAFQSSDLVGQWSGTAKDGTQVKFTFQKDGIVVWDVSDPDFKKQFPSGLQAKYALSGTGELMELDMDSFSDEKFQEKRLLGILQATGKNTFKLEFNEHELNAPRPEKFSDEAIIFTKGE